MPYHAMPCNTAYLFTFPRHRDEISKIPFYADSIMKMLKDIRRTVSASAKLQPGSNAFTQFLDEVKKLALCLQLLAAYASHGGSTAFFCTVLLEIPLDTRVELTLLPFLCAIASSCHPPKVGLLDIWSSGVQ